MMSERLDRSTSATSIWSSTDRGNHSRDDDGDISINTNSIRSNKSEGGGRRRTIIVERKNGSFGFTIQSYGIHYRKEKEIEVITYVERVEPDGAAANAGMREGDVIISINGNNVQLAEHATIVDIIATCETRMRMVVSFENCVRKVELHLKCISLQRLIEENITKLEELTKQEMQLFDGKWKSRSLPAQKKKNSPSEAPYDDQGVKEESTSVARPTFSTENVTEKPKTEAASIPIYQYLNPYQYIIRPTLCDVGFVVRMGLPNTPKNTHHIVMKSSKGNKQSTTEHVPREHQTRKSKSVDQSHSCSVCIPHIHTNPDGTSLEAYDLASPCCNPRCIPHTRRRSKKHKGGSSKERRKEKAASAYEKVKSDTGHYKVSKSNKYRLLESSPQNSAHSCMSSTYTDSNGYNSSVDNELMWTAQYDQPHLNSEEQLHYKPKSWDNLTTKSFGGYGYGYGYLDATQTGRHKGHGKSARASHSQSDSQQVYAMPHHVFKESPSAHRHSSSSTKSTENMLVGSKFQPDVVGSECCCQRPSTAAGLRTTGDDASASYYSRRVVYPTYALVKKKETTNSLVTRL